MDKNKKSSPALHSQPDMRNLLHSSALNRAGIVQSLNGTIESGDILTGTVNTSLEEIPEKKKSLEEWFMELKSRLNSIERESKPKIMSTPVRDKRAELIECGGRIK